jgi:hypothetical protein
VTDRFPGEACGKRHAATKINCFNALRAQMKPLEGRGWFVSFSLGVSALLMFGLWTSAGLSLSLPVGAIFMFATLGLWQAVNKMLAMLLIKLNPSLGAVK